MVPDLNLVSVRDRDIDAIVDDIFDRVNCIQLYYYVLKGAVFMVAGSWCHLLWEKRGNVS